MCNRTTNSQRTQRRWRAARAVFAAVRGHSVLIGIGALAVISLSAGPASARAAADACPLVALSQPFAQWGDPAQYMLAPDGDLEHGGAGWTLERGAGVVEGNEPFQVGAASDHLSLALPAESSATTAPQCIGVEHRTIRFFARSDSDTSGSLRVDALFETPSGTINVVPIGDVAARSSWWPVDALDAIVNRMAVSQDNTMSVRWRFTAQASGNWLIDDVYVDPFRSN